MPDPNYYREENDFLPFIPFAANFNNGFNFVSPSQPPFVPPFAFLDDNKNRDNEER